MTISTNAIRHFADRVRGLAGNNKELVLTAQDARNLNNEILALMARLLEVQDSDDTKIQVEVSPPKF